MGFGVTEMEPVPSSASNAGSFIAHSLYLLISSEAHHEDQIRSCVSSNYGGADRAQLISLTDTVFIDTRFLLCLTLLHKFPSAVTKDL